MPPSRGADASSAEPPWGDDAARRREGEFGWVAVAEVEGLRPNTDATLPAPMLRSTCRCCPRELTGHTTRRAI